MQPVIRAETHVRDDHVERVACQPATPFIDTGTSDHVMTIGGQHSGAGREVGGVIVGR